MEGAKRGRVEGGAVSLPGDDIDTDRIIPARFLTEITFEDLGRNAFADERFDERGAPRQHPLNDPRAEGAAILVVGRNFGCGSSREHAPQALMRMGFRAFVGESFAEIFSGNCTALGLPAVRVGAADARAIAAIAAAEPGTRVSIDLAAGTVTAGGRAYPGTMPASDLASLLSGAWDTLALLLADPAAIARAAARLPPPPAASRPVPSP